ncbi:MAG: hypothetical protein AB8B87_09375 [Granulosicoccus sp.]
MADQSVYLDVVFDEGLIFFELCNTGQHAVTNVRVAFDKPLHGMDNVDVSKLNIFRYLAFLPAGKRIRILLDTAQSFQLKRQRSTLKVTIRWKSGRTALSTTVKHDFRAYADFPHIVTLPDHRKIGHL